MLLISMLRAERVLVVSLCECVERELAGFDIAWENTAMLRRDIS
jgi:hypothetical protein